MNEELREEIEGMEENRGEKVLELEKEDVFEEDIDAADVLADLLEENAMEDAAELAEKDSMEETQPFIKIEAESQLEQGEDGVWRHTEESPFSPFYVPDKKQKKNNTITISLIALLLLFLIGGMIFAVSKLLEAAVGEARTAWDVGISKVEEVFGGEEEFQLEPEPDFPAPNSEYYDSLPEEDIGGFEDFIEHYFDEYGNLPFGDYDDGYDSIPYNDYGNGEEELPYFSEEYTYIPKAEDEFYLELANSLRDDLQYSAKFNEYTHYDPDTNVDIDIEYVEIEGDIPSVEQINEYLEDGAMYYLQELGSADISDVYLSVDSYVTYMDEKTLSVVVDERYIIGDYEYIQMDLYCMNFDMTTGALLYNTEIIEASPNLAAAFRKQSNYQNGEAEIVQELSDKEITEYMADEEALILYYTPVGLEVGFNYYDGWISATLKEYDDFLAKL